MDLQFHGDEIPRYARDDRSAYAQIAGNCPIVLPAVIAGVLVVALALQSVRAVQVHRRVVENALRDYAGFAVWQYTRRASDYLRLVLTATLPYPALTSRSLTTVDACAPAAPHTVESSLVFLLDSNRGRHRVRRA